MRQKYFRITGIIIVMTMTFLLISCGEIQKNNSGNVETGDTFDIRDDTAHIAGELTDNIFIDAEITPLSKYQNGLASYYTIPYVENDGQERPEDMNENPVAFNQKLTDILKLTQKKSSYRIKAGYDIQDTPIGYVATAESENPDIIFCGHWSCIKGDRHLYGVEYYNLCRSRDLFYNSAGTALLESNPFFL